MKHANVTRGGLTSLGLAMTLLCWPGLLAADQKPVSPPAVTPDPNGSKYDLEIANGQLIRPGGEVEATLPKVVDALRDRYTDANIVLSPGLANVRVADLKLRAGHLADELEAVRVAAGERFEIKRQSTSDPGIDPKTGLPLADAMIDAGLFALREVRPKPENQRIVEAINIGPYLEWLGQRPPAERAGNPEDQGLQEIQEIVSETITSFNGGSEGMEQPISRYHRGAKLLVITGTIESVEVVRKIVNALPGMSAMVHAINPASAPKRNATEEAFRKRYGLGPASAPSPEPENTIPEPGPRK